LLSTYQTPKVLGRPLSDDALEMRLDCVVEVIVPPSGHQRYNATSGELSAKLRASSIARNYQSMGVAGEMIQRNNQTYLMLESMRSGQCSLGMHELEMSNTK
jgi:hypothetical protein